MVSSKAGVMRAVTSKAGIKLLLRSLVSSESCTCSKVICLWRQAELRNSGSCRYGLWMAPFWLPQSQEFNKDFSFASTESLPGMWELQSACSAVMCQPTPQVKRFRGISKFKEGKVWGLGENWKIKLNRSPQMVSGGHFFKSTILLFWLSCAR